jgi:hypothetical protein
VSQTPSTQSVATAHFFVSAHFGHVPPPQSTSVSAPFMVPSVHEGAAAAHVFVPGSQTVLVQSEPVVQALELAHFGHVAPPQSTSVSAPSFTPSVHEGVAHLPPVHTPPVQSELLAQV